MLHGPNKLTKVILGWTNLPQQWVQLRQLRGKKWRCVLLWWD